MSCVAEIAQSIISHPLGGKTYSRIRSERCCKPPCAIVQERGDEILSVITFVEKQDVRLPISIQIRKRRRRNRRVERTDSSKPNPFALRKPKPSRAIVHVHGCREGLGFRKANGLGLLES